MATLRLILSDQLSMSISSLVGCDKQNDIILMCELHEEATYVKHHKKKIAFLFSAMRHFAQELRDAGYNVEYVTLDDIHNTGSLKGEVSRFIHLFNINKIIITHPGEFRILQEIKRWSSDFNLTVDIMPDDRFLCSPEEFASWARSHKQLRMEYFYRFMRQKYSILLDNNNHPVGGKWNYDSQNRTPPKSGLQIPSPFQAEPDPITQDVIKLVAKHYESHFGDVEPFYFAVTRDQALQALDHFMNQRIGLFGDYQDAMIEDEPWMYHSHLSFYLNCGLLLPMECIKAAEMAYLKGKAPLNAVEGFIRQILGWREYIRGVYWLRMPEYKAQNFLQAHRKLPACYWTAQTNMNCLQQCIQQTKELAYAHHIQRLMVLGNFTLLAGIHPDEVNEWYLIVYADAYEWVELPNVSGMILFADGGYLGSKPYAASGAYINKMSNYCKNCSYDVTLKNGSKACPFNYLYWNFLAIHREKLSHNQRLAMIYKTYDNMPEDRKMAIDEDSKKFLSKIDNDETI